MQNFNIDIVVPCYKVGDKIKAVIKSIPDICRTVYVVDDCCPSKEIKAICDSFDTARVKYLYNKTNLGVGGATLHGMKVAFNNGADIVIKIDGDGQMDPHHIQSFITPLIHKKADYVKGNRFYSLDSIKSMPFNRVILNLIVTILSKASSGYWNIKDPTNGYIAISRTTFENININKISKRYFFESDMLFNLYLIRAVVLDLPTKALYFDEKTNINIFSNIFIFSFGYLNNLIKRIYFYYILKDFGLGSIYLFFSLFFIGIGSIFGLSTWIFSHDHHVLASAGTVMLAALPLILGLQLFLAFMSIDFKNIPKFPISRH